MSEYQVELEPRQLVRSAAPGELLPVYTLDELLRGVCHVVRLSDADIKARLARNRGIANASIARQKRKETDMTARFAAVKKMLENHKTALEISIVLKLTVKTVQRYVSRHAELRDLSMKNPRYERKDKHSQKRFLDQETEIRQALKKEAFWAVAMRFGFGQKTLKRHLGLS